MQSSRSRLMLVALLGVLALGAFTATAAQAIPAPDWTITGTELRAGQTHFITAKIYSTASVLKTANVTVSCSVITLLEGDILGAALESAGKDGAVIEFSSCSVSGTAGGNPITKCTVESPKTGSPTPGVIITSPVKSELVETEKAEPAKEKGSLLTLFEPVSGVNFVTLKFTTETGGNCPIETKVSGKVAAQVRTDPENGTLGELIELGKPKKEAHSWLLNFPKPAIPAVTTINEGKTKEVTGIALKAFSEEATLEVGVLILLAKRNTTTGKLETESVNWSPLP